MKDKNMNFVSGLMLPALLILGIYAQTANTTPTQIQTQIPTTTPTTIPTTTPTTIPTISPNTTPTTTTPTTTTPASTNTTVPTTTAKPTTHVTTLTTNATATTTTPTTTTATTIECTAANGVWGTIVGYTLKGATPVSTPNTNTTQMCQNYCYILPHCYAAEFNFISSQCGIHTNADDNKSGFSTAANVTVYYLFSRCAGCTAGNVTWATITGEALKDGTLVTEPNTNTSELCKNYCSNQSLPRCYAADFNSASSQCRIHTNHTDIKLGFSSGANVTEYYLFSRCAADTSTGESSDYDSSTAESTTATPDYESNYESSTPESTTAPSDYESNYESSTPESATATSDYESSAPESTTAPPTEDLEDSESSASESTADIDSRGFGEWQPRYNARPSTEDTGRVLVVNKYKHVDEVIRSILNVEQEVPDYPAPANRRYYGNENSYVDDLISTLMDIHERERMIPERTVPTYSKYDGFGDYIYPKLTDAYKNYQYRNIGDSNGFRYGTIPYPEGKKKKVPTATLR